MRAVESEDAPTAIGAIAETFPPSHGAGTEYDEPVRVRFYRSSKVSVAHWEA